MSAMSGRGCSGLWIVFSGSLVQDRRRIHHSSFPLSPRRRDGRTDRRILPIPPPRSRPPSPPTCPERASERERRGCSLPGGDRSGALHLGGRCLPDVDTGGGGGVSFVVVARSERDGGRGKESGNRFGRADGCWPGENCRATTDDNAPSPKMIRIIWENFTNLVGRPLK